MTRKSTLKNKLIISIFFGCLVPYIVGGIYLNDFMEKWLFHDYLQNTNRTLVQISELIDTTLIDHVQEITNMLSDSNLIQTVDHTINNYTEYNPDNFVTSKSMTEKNIDDYFKNVKMSHHAVNFIFLGTEEGGYIEYPQFMPNKSYDPRQRPWYINTIGSDAINISDPYITQVTQEMILSFTKSVIFEDKKVGVVGVSVKIEDISQNIGNIRLGETGSIIVLNSNNKIVISKKNPEWILKTPDELNLNALQSLTVKEGIASQEILNDEEVIINVHSSPQTGWKIVSVIPKKEVVGEIQEMTNILVLITVLTLAITFLAVIIISRKITEPILSLSKVIDKMAVFDLEFYRQVNMDLYLKKEDEIGMIAKALAGMHNNFNELNDTIHKMDHEIQNVNIHQDTPVKLTLSESNPFNGVTQSFNLLLEKVHNYLEQLKVSNKEIHEKNQLLTTSEEELMAQLAEIESQKEYINFLAFHDPLTNLPNRRKFIEVLEYALIRNTSGAVILLDLDNFKGINDTMGHVFGDHVLRGLAQKLDGIVAENVFVSRFGGDEFLILIEDVTDLSTVELQIDKINKLFNERIVVEENEIEITFSMGISLFPQDSNTVNQLIMNADLALYSVKRLGKNGYRFFDSTMMDHLLRKSEIESIIREAIDTDGFKMVYQPQVNLKTGEADAYEALLRLKNHSISPAEFIPIAEDNGSIIKVGRIVTRKVIEQLSQWQSRGYKIKPVSINFSANQLHDVDYLEFTMGELEKNNVDPKYIEIEITENIFLENKEQTLVFLMKLKELGIKISIDDFGTGYSSLSYLTFLPLNKIKLDRSLNIKFLEIENIKVMDSLILLAHSLKLEVVAEGIETQEQVRRLTVAKCDIVQGYFFSKPLEVEDVEKSFTFNYTKPQ